MFDETEADINRQMRNNDFSTLFCLKFRFVFLTFILWKPNHGSFDYENSEKMIFVKLDVQIIFIDEVEKQSNSFVSNSTVCKTSKTSKRNEIHFLVMQLQNEREKRERERKNNFLLFQENIRYFAFSQAVIGHEV